MFIFVLFTLRFFCLELASRTRAIRCLSPQLEDMVEVLTALSGAVGPGNRRLPQSIADAVLEETEVVKGKPGSGQFSRSPGLVKTVGICSVLFVLFFVFFCFLFVLCFAMLFWRCLEKETAKKKKMESVDHVAFI